MTVYEPIIADQVVANFESAYVRINQWRGQMVEIFARAEHSVIETLLILNGNAGGKGQFPHLVGQRFERLGALLQAGSGVSHHYKSAFAALEDFREHLELRTMLCHGVTTVTLARSGTWVALIAMVVCKGQAVQRIRIAIEEHEAAEHLQKALKSSRKLGSMLGQVRHEELDRTRSAKRTI